MRRTIIFCCLLLIFLAGCEPASEKTTGSSPSAAEPKAGQTAAESAAEASTARLMNDPIEPTLLELPTGALPFWRQHTQSQPTLVLFSIHPLLEPLPDETRDAAITLAREGSLKKFDAGGSLFRANPILLATQTISAALDAGYFSSVIWVFPSTKNAGQLSLKTFRQQMIDARFLTVEEGNLLKLEEGIFSTSVRGVPFQAAHSSTLLKIDTPHIVHIDLGYLSGLYKNEEQTPIYDLLHSTASSLRDSRLRPLTTTLSYSTIEGAFSLATRFLIDNLADLLRQPSILEGTLPLAWELRSQALKGEEVFTQKKVLEFYQQAADLTPDQAAAHYDLSQALLDNGQLQSGLTALDRAVTLDPGYGYAYALLAQGALDSGKTRAALSLLEKGAAVFPANPIIRLQMAELLLRTDQPEKALEILEMLDTLKWSEYYHPEAVTDIDAMLQAAREAIQGS